MLIASPDFAEWKWLASGQEIFYGTPFNYPYTGPPSRLDAIGVATSVKRTVVAPTSIGRIIAYRFNVTRSQIYFEQYNLPDGDVSLYRAPLTGTSLPEQVVVLRSADSLRRMVTVSPDERTVAWVEQRQEPLSWSVVTMDVANGGQRVYPLKEFGDHVRWSPSGRSLVVEPENAWSASGTPFQWVDRENGAVRLWLAPANEVTLESSRTFRWEGETPWLYTTVGGTVVRYSIATGSPEQLGVLPLMGAVVGWSPDLESVVVATNECVRVGEGGCLRYASSVYRLELRSSRRTEILRHDGSGRIFGQLSPTGSWFAYAYSSCGGGCYAPGDGLYVVRVP